MFQFQQPGVQDKKDTIDIHQRKYISGPKREGFLETLISSLNFTLSNSTMYKCWPLLALIIGSVE